MNLRLQHRRCRMPETDQTPLGLIARMKARYAENAAKQDMPKARRIGIMGAAVVFILIGGYRIAQRHSRADDTALTAGVMPLCASPAVRQLLKQAIEEAPGAKQANAVLQRIGTVQETGYVPVGAKGFEIRLCQADVFLNLGRHDVPFTLTWISPEKDALWIEAETPF